MSRVIKTDICVIGAGSGGLSVAAGAVQMGARVVLIEGGAMGGDCLNTGCVPSKSLIAAAKAAQAQRKSAVFGIKPVEPEVDFAAVKDHVHRVIETIAPVDSQARFEGLGCTVLRDYAQFTAPDQVIAGNTIVQARRFVVATGSRPFVPSIPGLAETPYLTNETIFDLRDRPDHLIVLGGGPIGLEMAQAHRRLGCKVTVITSGRILGKEDPELNVFVTSSLCEESVEIIEGMEVTHVSGRAGEVDVTLCDGRVLRGSHLLVATGRRVDVSGLGLEAAKVAYTAKGITVDASLRSSNRRVYAVGDVASGQQFTHLAGYHAGVVIRQIVLGLPGKAKTSHIPRVTYTEPELAQVGLTEAEARLTHGDGLTVIRQEFQHNDRAIAGATAAGMIKLIVVKGRPVGVGIVGPNAGELIAPWALALSSGLKLSAIAGMVLPYPTLGEISKRAAGAYFSPKLFANPVLKQVVRFVQKLVP